MKQKEDLIMTNVKIDPGVCGLITAVTANSEDGMEVILQVKSGCGAVNAMFASLGTTFDSYELCLAKPGEGPLYEYAAQNFPGHCACPAISGIIKAAEVECKLALPKNASIVFE
ncbi:MAG: hypothetical protein RR415_04470 [Ruthenibacterium sp.]